MTLLLIGIFLFFGIHSVSIFALPLRDRLAAKNELVFKGVYSLISLIGLVLIIKGYSAMRITAEPVYLPPTSLQSLSMVLLVPVFILLFAPYFPGRIKTHTGHPQYLGALLWSVAHLLANGTLADILLFGSFLLWALAGLCNGIKRTARPTPGAPTNKMNDLILIVIGLGTYAGFVFYLHGAITGIALIR